MYVYALHALFLNGEFAKSRKIIRQKPIHLRPYFFVYLSERLFIVVTHLQLSFHSVKYNCIPTVLCTYTFILGPPSYSEYTNVHDVARILSYFASLIRRTLTLFT